LGTSSKIRRAHFGGCAVATLDRSVDTGIPVQRLDRVTVLVASYDRWIRLSLVTTLHAAGFSVTEVSNGMAAVRAAVADPPHVVLADRGLPELDGPDLAAALRAEPGLGHTLILHSSAGLAAQPLELVARIIEALEERSAPRRVTARPIPAPERAPTRPRELVGPEAVAA
jgi:CheY-like chemotaxis protein